MKKHIDKLMTLTKLEKLKLIGLSIEAATGIIGGSLILVENHPYLTLTILALGAVATKITNFITERENKNQLERANEIPK